MPTIRANDLDIAYEVHGAGPPLVMLHGATSIGREDFAAQIPAAVEGVPAPPARCARPRPDGLGRSRRLPLRLARRGPRRVRRRAGPRDVPPARLLDGRDDGSAVRRPLRRATADAGRRRDHDAARAAHLGRPQVDGPAPRRRRRSGVGRDPGRRHDAGQGVGAWRRLLPAIAADVASQPLLTPGELRAIESPAMVVCGDRDPFVPVGPRLGAPAPAAGRPAARRARLRPRGDGPAPGPVQRCADGLLPLDRIRGPGARGTAASRRPSRRRACNRGGRE